MPHAGSILDTCANCNGFAITRCWYWNDGLGSSYKGRNRFWGQHKGTGGDPSAWGDRKASILNVTPPSNVC